MKVFVSWGDGLNKSWYNTTLTDIADVASAYGHAEDFVALYTDDNKLVGVAQWPIGYRRYEYITDPEALSYIQPRIQ